MSSEIGTRRKILTSALALIRRRKSADVSLGQIAAAAKVSRQAIYLHFRDRADLLVALIRHVDESRGLSEKIRAIEQAPTGRDAVRKMVALQASDNPAVWPIARMFDAVRRSDDAVERSWQDRLEHRLEGCRAIVARLKAENALRRDLDPRVASDILWTMTSLRMWEDLIVLRGWTAEDYQRHVMGLLDAALIDPRAATHP